ncbi:MAG: RHS repeat-associated core domain-containing protein [Anaerolineales bacterium]|nr:RHS repeat-associated core domain-containing protein [Anaerolineales bacterium]
MDLNTGLTQALSDGTNTYIYGMDRLAQVNMGTEYFLGDALGSVRQITNNSGSVTLARSYDPYGDTRQTLGDAQTNYGFTGEFLDPSGLIYLRARYYDSLTGRFTTRDTWEGDDYQPISYNKWVYVYDNPINLTDPTGQCPIPLLCQVLVGGVIGGLTGAVIGAAYAGFMYDLSLQGRCGCEGVQIIQQYTKSQFVFKGAGQGALFGVIFGALASVGAGGVAITALAGMGLSTAGIIDASLRLAKDLNNECAWWDLGLSVFGLVASGFTLKVSASMFYNKAVKNPGARATLFGRHIEGSPASYEKQASSLGFRHLNMEKGLHNQFKLIFGEKLWWKLINEPFVRATAQKGDPVYFTNSPKEILNLPRTLGTFKEYTLLRSLGYKNPTLVDPARNLWIMIKP